MVIKCPECGIPMWTRRLPPEGDSVESTARYEVTHPGPGPCPGKPRQDSRHEPGTAEKGDRWG
jgi:hypothetical protein